MPVRSSRSNSEPRAPGSTRRSATVVSSVPEATSASSSTSRLGAPPVPMIRRDPSFSPAMTSGSPAGRSLKAGSPGSGAGAERGTVRRPPRSTPLGDGQDLDLVAVDHVVAGPGAAGHHLAVDGHGQAP